MTDIVDKLIDAEGYKMNTSPAYICIPVRLIRPRVVDGLKIKRKTNHKMDESATFKECL